MPVTNSRNGSLMTLNQSLTAITDFLQNHVLFSLFACAVIAVAVVWLYLIAHEQFCRWRKKPVKSHLVIGVTSSLYEEALNPEIENQFRGYLSDVSKSAGAVMASTVSVADVQAEDVADILKKGSVDAVIVDGTTASTMSPEIELMSCYLSSLHSLALVFWDKSPHSISSLKDFAFYANNFTGVVKDSIEDHYLSRFKGIEVKHADSLTNTVIDLKLGIVRAILVKMTDADRIRREYKNARVIPISLQEKGFIQEERLAVLRANTELVREFEQAFATLRRKGTLKTVHKRWFK
jgi:ABC-type amino acid transport substrate-binding protein